MEREPNDLPNPDAPRADEPGVEPGQLQGTFADILERGLRERQRLPRPVLAWSLARDLIGHMVHCRYRITLAKGDGRFRIPRSGE
ncbi:MAG: hypothetical protein U1E53_16355 [Dongiaceae bacterium]